MVEVFKTNVQDRDHAVILVDHIHQAFQGYRANFDLEDCDKILRVASTHEFIRASCLIKLLGEFGYEAEVLPDDF
ncbi:hypothetical protein HUW51_15080 [Adhaeribacter swui]|uniref:Uncharacterized protein n=1 Tax=Adhaeribacter swui TaxID=2086471 RepID=A0A7G7G9Z6_9BACT|nr:hypothetical protein [Adhaeribacter swui]QNF33980.1 hypothetical protein HUW51_15080 [Adhaeribacter swui]